MSDAPDRLRLTRYLVAVLACGSMCVASPPAKAAAPLTVTGFETQVSAADCVEFSQEGCPSGHAADSNTDFATACSGFPCVGPASFSKTFTEPTASQNQPSGQGQANSNASVNASLANSSGQLTLTVNASAGASASTGPNGSSVEGSANGGVQTNLEISLTQTFSFKVTGNGTPASNGNGCSAGGSVQQPSSLDGTLPPGDYEFVVTVNASCFGFSSSAYSGSTSASGNFTITLKPVSNQCSGVTQLTVGLAKAQGCFVERQDPQGHGTGVFETDQEAWVGGFDLNPRSGGKLVVEPTNHAAPVRAEGSGVDWVLSPSFSINAPLSDLHPFTPSFTLGLNTSGSIGRVAAVPLLQGVSGQVKVTWAPDGSGATMEAGVSIEDLTKSVGDVLFTGSGAKVGTVSGKLTLSFVNGQPFEVTAGDLQIPEFAVELKDSNPPLKEGFGGAKFTARKVGASVEWSGEGTVLFPWEGSNGTNQGKITGRLFFTDAKWTGIGLGAAGFEEPIGETGWDLTGVNGNVIVSPQLAFEFGVTAKEHLSFAGVPLFTLTGSVKAFHLATECTHGGNPFEFLGTANIPPLEVEKLGQGTLTVTMCAYVPSARNFAFEAKVAGDVDIDIASFKKLFKATGSASGWFQGSGNRFLSTNFNLDGSYELTLPIIGKIGATGVLSSEGYAFCGTYGFISEGFGTTNWLDAPQDLTGCDFTPFRVPTPPPPAADRASAAAAGDTVNVPAGQRAFGFEVRGSGGAPRVRVLGPHGERFSTPAGDVPLKTRAAIIIPVDALKTTYVYLHKPSAGAWRLVPLPGSVPISRVATARQLPQPHVSARLTRLAGGRVRLAWKASPIHGQQIELLDRAQGVATVIQQRTTTHQGVITFSPASPLAKGRFIEADVFQNGRPRARVIARRYRLSLPPLPGRVTHLVATRTTAGLSTTWRRAPRAHDYLVTLSTGARVLSKADTTRTGVVFTHPPQGTVTVKVRPLDSLGRFGPLTTVRTG